MIIRFTDKLAKKLKLGPITKIDDYTSNPYLEWYANYFTANRVQYIIVTNAASLLTIVMYGRGISDYGLFQEQFISQLGDYLKEIGCELIFDRIIKSDMGPTILSKNIDKSVTGSMTRMIYFLKFKLEANDMSPWDLTEYINTTNFNAIDFQEPIEAFKSLKLDKQS